MAGHRAHNVSPEIIRSCAVERSPRALPHERSAMRRRGMPVLFDQRRFRDLEKITDPLSRLSASRQSEPPDFDIQPEISIL
jgi:hypothetical protein